MTGSGLAAFATTRSRVLPTNRLRLTSFLTTAMKQFRRHLSAHEQLHESEQERLQAFLPGRNGKAKGGGVCSLPSLWVSVPCANGRRKESGTVQADRVQARKSDRRAIHPPVDARLESLVELSPSCRRRPLQRHAHSDRDVQRRCSFLGGDRKATNV